MAKKGIQSWDEINYVNNKWRNKLKVAELSGSVFHNIIDMETSSGNLKGALDRRQGMMSELYSDKFKTNLFITSIEEALLFKLPSKVIDAISIQDIKYNFKSGKHVVVISPYISAYAGFAIDVLPVDVAEQYFKYLNTNNIPVDGSFGTTNTIIDSGFNKHVVEQSDKTTQDIKNLFKI